VEATKVRSFNSAGSANGPLQCASIVEAVQQGSVMSLRRTALCVLAFLSTAGMTSVASAGCCGWGVQAPVAYASAGCGGCGTPTAAVVYAQPVAPTPPPVVVRGWDWTPTWGAAWGTNWGCCHRTFVYAATPAVELMPVAPAPIYVVNQGPDYTGPGIVVPYHTWTPASSYVVPGSYPYLSRGYHRWGYRYGWRRPFLATRHFYR
jgi:hypothetical protein